MNSVPFCWTAVEWHYVSCTLLFIDMVTQFLHIPKSADKEARHYNTSWPPRSSTFGVHQEEHYEDEDNKGDATSPPPGN